MNNGKAKWQLMSGEPIEFEWTNFPGFSALQLLHRIQYDLENSHIEPEQFSDRFLFMSIFTDIDIYSIGYEVACTSTSDKVRQQASNFVKGHWTSLARKRREVVSWENYKPDGKWDSIASSMVKDFEETGHPVFKGISALTRGIMRKKKSKDTTQYNGESSNVELLYQIIHSANQLCICGAFTNWCETLGRTEFEKRNNSGKELTSHLLNNHDVNTEEISSLVKIPRTLIASGNRKHQIISSFESLSPRSLLKYLYQRAGFYCPVERKYYVTLPDIDDGQGNLIPLCRECSHPREFSCSRCVVTIKEKTHLEQS